MSNGLNDHDLLIRIDAAVGELKRDLGEFKNSLTGVEKRVRSLESFRTWAQAYGAGMLFALGVMGAVLKLVWEFMKVRGITP